MAASSHDVDDFLTDCVTPTQSGADPHGDTGCKDSAAVLSVALDASSVAASTPDVQRERLVAMHDLAADGHIELHNGHTGPFRLLFGVAAGALLIKIGDAEGRLIHSCSVSFAPLRPIIRDYMMLCESYYEAIRSARPSQIEAIDMGRRGLHDDGAGELTGQLAGQAEIDHRTARRLFTLVCALKLRV